MLYILSLDRSIGFIVQHVASTRGGMRQNTVVTCASKISSIRTEFARVKKKKMRRVRVGVTLYRGVHRGGRGKYGGRQEGDQIIAERLVGLNPLGPTRLCQFPE